MRRRLIFVLVLLALALGGDALAWRWVEGQLDTGFAAWVALRRAEGWTVTHGPATHAGWPLAARLDIPDITLSRGPAAARWSVPRVSLEVAFITPGSLVVGFHGEQHVRAAGTPDIAFTAGHMTATAPLNPATPEAAALDMDIGDLRATLPDGDLTATRLQLHADASQSYSLSAGDVALPPPPGGAAWPLGARIASIVIAADIVGALPPGPNLPERAAQWRDLGGRVDLPHVSIGWGALGVTGKGTLSLDRQLQPSGSFTLRIVGYDEALDAFATTGTLPPRAAAAAKAVLGLIAHIPDGGGTPVVDAPVTLGAGQLMLGQIPVAHLPTLIWPSL